jgi:hypothetical protein
VTHPNPFEQAPAAQEQQQAQAPNPFGAATAVQQQQQQQQPAPAPAPAQAPNPFPAPQPQQAPANPFPAPGQQAAGVATYGAPAQQQYAPPAPQQQYAPAPAPVQQQWQQPAQAPQQQAPAFDMGRFGSAPPPEVTGGKGAQLADMYGRLVIVFPLQVTTVPRRPEYITEADRANGNVNQQQLTATVVVLDGGPGTRPGGTIEWGGKPHGFPPVPHTNSDPLPYVRKAMWIKQSRIIVQAQAFLPQGPGQPPAPMIGRVTKAGPAHNDPWFIAGASPEEVQLAQTYIDLVMRGQYPHPLA